jgi:4-hydroxy-tetrahydrodipicolinate synthase
MRKLEGVFPIVLTPFHDDGSIDMDSQKRLVRYLIDSGAHGLGLFANASEGYALSGAERLELTKIILRQINGRVPVIVSTGHTGTDVAVEMSREAEAAGADALMVLPPYFLKPEGEGLFHYYRKISEAVHIPIMVQDAPLLTQVAMAPALLARMAAQIEHVRYVKVEALPTAPKITEIVKAASTHDLKLFGGLNGHFLLEELGRGSCGTMPGSDLIPEFVKIWNLYRDQKHGGARAEFNRCLPLIRYELQPGLGVSVMKHNLKQAGIIESARVRHPTRALDELGAGEVQAILETMEETRAPGLVV